MPDSAGTNIRPTNFHINRPVHGSIKPSELRSLGLNPAEVLDFSASINPLGPPLALQSELQKVDLTTYPDPECLKLREAIGQHLDIDPSLIFVGNGSTEIIHLIARLYLGHEPGGPESVFILTPTYDEYRGASELMRSKIISLDCEPNPPFSWDWDTVFKTIRIQKPALTFLCNPNNPTGVYTERDDITKLASTLADVGGILVIDEAYANFVEGRWESESLTQYGNVILLRSMTKDYALTGLRLGYSIASPEITKMLASLQPDWSVNSLAQVAGIVALTDNNYLINSRQAIKDIKTYLISELESQGFNIPIPNANFILVETKDAHKLRTQLLMKGIVVRDCTSFGLPNYVRVGIRKLQDCKQLVVSMQELINDGFEY